MTLAKGGGTRIALIYRTGEIVDIECMWQDKRQSVEAGCEAILKSIQVIPLSSD